MSEADHKAQRDADFARVEKAVEELSEHFGAVHIFCSRYDGLEAGGSHSFDRGAGSWFARYGQVREWLVFEDERVRAHARQQEQNRLPDGSPPSWPET